MYFLGGQALERPGALKRSVEIVHEEIQCLGRGMRFPVGRNIHHLKSDRATGEVASRTRLQTPRKSEQLAVELRGFVQVTHLHVNSEKARHVIRLRADL